VINEDHQIYKINSNTEFSIIPDNDTVESINKKKLKLKAIFFKILNINLMMFY